MDVQTDHEMIDALIKRVFYVEDITQGSSQLGYILRYRGRLISEDSIQAYALISDLLKPHNLTPLFRSENGQQVILLIPGLPAPKPSRPTLNLLMFLLTVISVVFAGGYFTIAEPLPKDLIAAAKMIITKGWPFAVALLSILAAHEFGHYLAGRAHGVKVSLPFFIPMPFSPLGTMGAFINMKEPPRNKRVLMDIGVAGPIAGYLVSIIVIWIGLSLSTVSQIPTSFPAGQGLQIEGNSITYLLLKWLHFGQLLPQPASYGDVSPLLYWIKYFFTGKPFPLGGMDVMIHPVAWAGWAGLLVTSLNLIPAGQLDGGHIFHLMFGKNGAKKLFPILLLVLVGLGFVWSGWWFWAAMVFLLGRVYAEPLDQITQLDTKRKILGIIALIIFLLTFIPIPLSISV
jgi:membrane-associated protease RseP (regulator of RpoE activity)